MKESLMQFLKMWVYIACLHFPHLLVYNLRLQISITKLGHLITTHSYLQHLGYSTVLKEHFVAVPQEGSLYQEEWKNWNLIDYNWL